MFVLRCAGGDPRAGVPGEWRRAWAGCGIAPVVVPCRAAALLGVSAGAAAADAALIESFATGRETCPEAASDEATERLATTREVTPSLAGLGSGRHPSPDWLTGIEVMAAAAPNAPRRAPLALCTVRSAAQKDRDARPANADRGTRRIAEPRACADGVGGPVLDYMVDGSACRCRVDGGTPCRSVGQAQSGGELRIAVTGVLPPAFPVPCREASDA